MKILFTTGRIHQIGGGAERSATTLIRKLSEKHHVCVFNIVFEPQPEKNPGLIGSNIEIIDWNFPIKTKKTLRMPYHARLLSCDIQAQRELNKIARNFQPEIVIAQKPPVVYEDPIPSNKAPIITFVRDTEYLDPFNIEHKCFIHYNTLFMKLRQKRMLKLLKKSNLLIVASDFMREKLNGFGLSAEVVPPFIEFEKYASNPAGDRDSITMIAANLAKHKGVDIFLRIAEKCPDLKFLLVGRLPEEHGDLPSNVVHLRWTDDIKSILAKTMLLLVPSRWEEPFGRLPVEAGVNGIPSIASNRGGLVEAVGEGGILIQNYEDIDLWVEAITSVLNNSAIYNSLSKNAIENANRFEFCYSYAKFTSLVKEYFGIEL